MAREVLRSGTAMLVNAGRPPVLTEQPNTEPKPEKRPGEWFIMDHAPQDGSLIWLAGAGVIHKGRWCKEGFWQDLNLTGTSPKPLPCLFQPVAWSPAE